MTFGSGPPLLSNSRGPGDLYPLGGPHPYMMPQYIPNYYPTGPQPYPMMAFGAANSGINSGQLPMSSPVIPSSDQNTNENANTNVNINSASFRRSLHRPSKE